MGKKVYHIVDPETGKIVGETRYGLVMRFLLFTTSKEGRLAFWGALAAVIFLCLMLSALEPALPRLPVWIFSAMRGIPWYIVVFALLRAVSAVAVRLPSRAPEPPSEEYKFYNIVDSKTGKIVDRKRALSRKLSARDLSIDSETGENTEKLRHKRWDKVHTIGFYCCSASGVFLLLSFFLRNSSGLLLGFSLYSCVILCIGGLALADISSYFMKKNTHNNENKDAET